MKIKTKTIEEFLTKVKLAGSQRIDDAILDFQEEGLVFKANSMVMHAMTNSILKKEAFTEYEALGKIGVNNMSQLVSIISRFNEEITISKNGNLLEIKGTGKKVEFELINENAITSYPKKDIEFKYENFFTITSDKLKEIIADIKQNSDTQLIITTEEDKVVFKNTGKYKFTHEIEAKGIEPKLYIKFGSPLIDSIENVIKYKNDIVVGLTSNYPMTLTETTDISVVSIIAVPRVDNE